MFKMQVITIQWEQYITKTQFYAALDASGINTYLFAKNATASAQWPALGEMIASNKRVVMFNDQVRMALRSAEHERLQPLLRFSSSAVGFLVESQQNASTACCGAPSCVVLHSLCRWLPLLSGGVLCCVRGHVRCGAATDIIARVYRPHFFTFEQNFCTSGSSNTEYDCVLHESGTRDCSAGVCGTSRGGEPRRAVDHYMWDHMLESPYAVAEDTALNGGATVSRVASCRLPLRHMRHPSSPHSSTRAKQVGA